MQPFEFDPERKVAKGNGLTVANDCGGEMFRRRAIKGIGGTPHRVEFCVIKKNGVYVYVSDGSVIVSDKDLLP